MFITSYKIPFSRALICRAEKQISVPASSALCFTP